MRYFKINNHKFDPDLHNPFKGINDIKGIKHFKHVKNWLIVYCEAIPLISRKFILNHIS